MWIQLSFLYLCCVVLFFAKVVIYHCMNVVFSKVARFSRIVQLNPLIFPSLGALFSSLFPPFSALRKEKCLPVKEQCFLSFLSVLFGFYESIMWNLAKNNVLERKTCGCLMCYWSGADFVLNIVKVYKIELHLSRDGCLLWINSAFLAKWRSCKTYYL